MSLPARWDSLLAGLTDQGRYRELRCSAGVDFVSNDYLGYCGSRQPGDFRPFLADPRARSGASSRLVRGQQPIWDQVEERLARWHQAESALLFNSGYVANEGLLSTIIDAGDWVASDQLNHASIIDGLRLSRAEKFIFRHQDLQQLEDGLRAAALKRGAKRELFVVTESLFGMDGDLTPLLPLADLTDRHGAHLIVDEAHSTGCFGPAGAGCVDAAGLRQRVLATVHTGGKAIGAVGAYVCGAVRLRDLLINRCRHFIYTTAMPPALGAWWVDALDRVQADDRGRASLHENAAWFRAELDHRRVEVPSGEYIVPIILGDDARAVAAAEQLQQRGWDVRAIRPPSVPPGTARLRISIHADHDRDTLIALAAAIAELTP
jgi:8-amino-7-oxononanoate synthase